MKDAQEDTLPFFEPEVVLYHADCPDGFGAAWAVWGRCPTARFVMARHGQPPPDGLAGKRLVILDFSYARPTIEQLASSASALAILDHHVSAQQALGDLPYTHYEQDKSGAVLAWEWAHRTSAPWLLQYVQDKDLHHWQLPESRAINAAIESYSFDFDVWSGLQQDCLVTEGRAILRAQEQFIDKLLRTAVMVRFEGETVPAVHSSILRSELGERLALDYPFCLVWYEREGRRYVSLRSRDGGADVSRIAQAHGGGGHRHAASFSMPIVEGQPMPFTIVAWRME
jgi:oligoribonuclease NrnB/cAMP/cGMP phosphodiesterase (DHH superfamily)